MSANILDFLIPQKHVLSDVLAMETGGKAGVGEVQIQASRAGEPGSAPGIGPVQTAESKGMSLKFEIQPATNPTSDNVRAARLENPGFGRVFTDHMAIVR